MRFNARGDEPGLSVDHSFPGGFGPGGPLEQREGGGDHAQGDEEAGQDDDVMAV
jgi:hypothetical protein